jgi:predicted phosphodiesterase
MLVKLMELLDERVIAIYGNHDVHENEINENDSLSVLAEAGRIRLLDNCTQFFGIIGSRPVVIGGTPWGQRLPNRFDAPPCDISARPLVFWLTHHDIVFPGYEELGRFKPMDLPGIDVVINGHIHRRIDTARVGSTIWLNPGNISRRSRSDSTREHIPSVMRIDITSDNWNHEHVEVPHRCFDDVFHEVILEDAAMASPSAFVAGLAELQSYRTQTGEGLMAFLDRNFDKFESDVTEEIKKLAQEVVTNG